MNITTDLIDELTVALLQALRAGGANLAIYSIAILAITATITYYKDYAMVVMHGTGLGDALAGLLTFAAGIMGYYFVMVNLFDIANAFLTTAINWGLAGTGGTQLTTTMIEQPGFIMTEGLKAAYPMAEQASWFDRIKMSLKLLNKPGDMLAYGCVVFAFLAITVHHMIMLIEYHLSVMCGAVLIPWHVWSTTSHIGEFGIGWITGAFVRALVSTAMLGISVNLFHVLNRPAEGWITLYNSVMLVCGSFIFAALCWVIPARAAGIASRGMALGLNASTITTSAMSVARYGMMVNSVASVATRAHSRMVEARQRVPQQAA